VYCPQCAVEYRDGFTECADCHVPLAAGLPPGPRASAGGLPDPDLEVVVVLESGDPLVITWAKAVLEEAGIPFYVQGEERGPIMEAITGMAPPWGGTWCRVQVGRDREAEARTILRPIEESKQL